MKEVSSTSPKRSFRASIATLAIGTVCLTLITFDCPHLLLTAIFTELMLIALLFAWVVDLVLAGANRKVSGMQFSLRQMLLVTACLAFYLSLLCEPWTFRLRFAVSRPALERLAAQLEQGSAPDPQWAGLFFIKKATREKRNDETLTVLWTESESGFVHPAPKPSADLSHLPGSPGLFNDYSTALQRDPEWFYFI